MFWFYTACFCANLLQKRIVMSHTITLPQSYPHHIPMADTINSFAVKHKIMNLYLSDMPSSGCYLLLIYLDLSVISDTLLQSKWIRKAFHKYNTHVILLAKSDITRHFTMGTLFLYKFGSGANLVFQCTDHSVSYPELAQQLKKFKTFKNNYFHTHQLLYAEIQKALSSDALTRAYHLYSSLFEHHLLYLELFYMGRFTPNKPLEERFLILEQFLPQFSHWMLKKSTNSYYITRALQSAQTADEQQEDLLLQSEFSTAISKLEQQLYNLVQSSFSDIKKAVKKTFAPVKPLIPEPQKSPYLPVIQILTQRFNIQEIFLFHQQNGDSDEQKILYLLLISNSISNQDLSRMVQIISDQTNSRYLIVPIAHSLSWIQEHLFEYQTFFQKIMIPENSIYVASHPSLIHWHVPYTDKHPDLDYYVRHCFKLYNNYTLFRDAFTSSTLGLEFVAAPLLYRACTTLLYATLSYRPNHIHFSLLWKLCEYAEPKLKQLNYLNSKLSFDFFTFGNFAKHKSIKRPLLNSSDITVLNEIILYILDLLKDKINTSG